MNIDEMDIKELKIRYRRLKKVHDSTNEAVERLEKDIVELIAENQILEAKNKQLLTRMDIQDNVVHNALENQNKQNNIYLERIKVLEGGLNGN